MSDKADIVHVITGLGQGGAEGVLYNLCSRGSVEPQRIHVVSLSGRGVYGPLLEKLGVRVTNLGLTTDLRWIPQALELVNQLRRDRPVVQTWMYHADLVGGILARAAGLRSISWNIRHANVSWRHNRKRTVMVIYACAALSWFVPRIIVTCSAAAQRSHVRIGYMGRRFERIANGCDLSRFAMDSNDRAVIRTEFGLRPDDFVVGMVARADRQKDHATLVQAIASLSGQAAGLRCVLVGRGLSPHDSWINALLDEHGVSDRFLLLGARSDVPRIMRALDVHVLSSLGEGFPNVLVEAMASGTPCIASAVGDAPDIIGEVGWIVPVRDSASLATAIQACMHEWSDDPEAWRQRKEKSRQAVVSQFSMERMVEQYEAVWTRLRSQHGQ